jgi:hypothetical protein
MMNNTALNDIVRPFELGGETLGSFDPLNKLEAQQVFYN